MCCLYVFFTAVVLQPIHIRKFDGLVRDCSNSIVNALELSQSCTNPSTYPSRLRSWHWSNHNDSSSATETIPKITG